MLEESNQFTFKLPNSQAKLPAHLKRTQQVFKPIIPQRKQVQSYFRPSLSDVCREDIKQQMRSLLVLQPINPGEQADPVEPIPAKDLFGTLDKQHLVLKEWKARLQQEARPTTFGNDARFKDIVLPYS